MVTGSTVRRASILMALLALALAAATTATTSCSSETRAVGDSGSGGGGEGGDATGAGGNDCSQVCPPPASPCRVVVCPKNECALALAPKGDYPDATPDDCMAIRCNEDGSEKPVAEPVGTLCNGGIDQCDKAGACVDCVDNNGCDMSVAMCSAGVCVPL